VASSAATTAKLSRPPTEWGTRRWTPPSSWLSSALPERAPISFSSSSPPSTLLRPFLTRFDMGIGINTGDVMSGNVGSQRRLEFTAIGDTTNTAARLETMTKGTPHQVFLSDSTRSALAAVPDDLASVGELEVRGRSGRLEVWTLAGVDKPVRETAMEEASPPPDGDQRRPPRPSRSAPRP
jgi:class 3 adenylate cyclase